LRGIATFEEIQRSWNINDLFDANEALDIQDEIEEFAAKRR
jgi:hypothetical protein